MVAGSYWCRWTAEKTANPSSAACTRQGFRAISAGTFAKPGDGGSALLQTMQEFDATDKVLLFEADSSELSSKQLLRKLVHECWQLRESPAVTANFAQFRPLDKWLQRRPELDPQTAFAARILLIHDYRRILLQDTPPARGITATGMAGRRGPATGGPLVQGTGGAVNRLPLYSAGERNGKLPAPIDSFWSRFGRLAP